MSNVVINMDIGEYGVEGKKVDETHPAPPVEFSMAKPSTLAKLEKLSAKNAEMAEERGAWKSATSEQRAAAKAHWKKSSKLQAKAIEEHNEYLKG